MCDDLALPACRIRLGPQLIILLLQCVERSAESGVFLLTHGLFHLGELLVHERAARFDFQRLPLQGIPCGGQFFPGLIAVRRGAGHCGGWDIAFVTTSQRHNHRQEKKRCFHEHDVVSDAAPSPAIQTTLKRGEAF